MAALRKSQRIFSGIGYIGNFLGRDVKPGDIYQLDDRQFILLANITDLAGDLTLDKKNLSVGTRSNLSYAKESNVNVKLKGSAGASHLAKGEVELHFSRKNSAFISVKNAVITEVKMELVRDVLQEVWEKKKYKKNGRHVFVSQVVSAASGTVIFSQDRDNKVIIGSTVDEAISSVARIGGGAVEFVTNSKATLECISTEPFIPMFKAVYLRNNGRFALLG